MKQYAMLCLVVAVIMLVAPLAAFLPDKIIGDKAVGDETSSAEYQENVSDNADKNDDENDSVTVFMTEENNTENMQLRDYVIGVVAAEMPASYETEALKAQALVAVTYVKYVISNGGDSENADISDDSSRHQGYMSVSQMQDKWGDTFDSYYPRIEEAVDAVIDNVITYEGEPILAAYHAISCGKTESAANLWGRDIPYLVSVDSEWDKNSARYSAETVLTSSEFRELFSDEDIDFDDDESGWIEITSVSQTGSVLEVSVCGKKYSGTDFRNILSLRSPVFSAEYNADEFVFTVSGYGHGIGMSQNGANAMAKSGSTVEEIINHYYPGTEII